MSTATATDTKCMGCRRRWHRDVKGAPGWLRTLNGRQCCPWCAKRQGLA